MTQLIEIGFSDSTVRAGVMRELLTYLDCYSSGMQRDVRAAMPREIDERLEASGALTWFSAAEAQFVLEALWSVAGSEKAMDLLASFSARYVRSPFLKHFFETTSTSIEALVYASEIAWELVFQNVAEIEVIESSLSHAVIRLSEVDPDILLSSEFLQTFAAGFVGLLRASKVAGEVKVDHIDYDFQRVDFVIGWGNH